MNKAQLFRELHKKGEPLILANAWDKGTARLLVAKGAKAIGTSSAAHAFTLGRPDMGHISRSEAMDHASDLIDAVDVPVSGDFENGFAPEPSDLIQTIREAHAIGLAGISIEDTDLPSAKPYDFETALARIELAAQTARKLNSDFVLCARADGIMNGHYDTNEAIKRLQAFEAVGADVLYAPLPENWDNLRRIIDSVNAPVNVLVAGAYSQYSYDDFAKIGAARLSFGSALARITHRVIMDAADQIFDHGNFSDFQNAASGDLVDKLIQ